MIYIAPARPSDSLAGSDTIGSLAGTGGTVTLGANNLTLAGNDSTSFAGSLTGSGTFTKNGAGTLTLSVTGSITGDVAFADGATFQFDPVTPLTIDSGSATFANFGIDDVAGLSSSTPDGTSTLIAGTVNSRGSRTWAWRTPAN